jgi:DNA repair exonuclease SbcCD ATPase subunit
MWGLYGDSAGRPEGAVRLGTKSAFATVDLQLPNGRTVSITRELPLRLPKTKPAPASATLDGEALNQTELEAILRDAFGAEIGFLSRVTMLDRTDLDSDASTLNLQEHLCQFFGIDELQVTLDELHSRQKAIEKAVRAIKQTVGPSSTLLKELRKRQEETGRQAQGATETLQQEQTKADSANQTLREAQAFEASRKREIERSEAIKRIASQIAELSQDPVDSEDLPAVLDAMELDATAHLDEMRRQTGLLKGQISAVERAMAQLEGEDGICPVCRRPLSEEDSNHARSSHQQDLLDLQRQLSALQEDPLVDRLRLARDIRGRLLPLLQREDQPAPALSLEEAQASAATSQAVLENAREKVIETRAEAMRAQSELETAEADQEANQLLTSQFQNLGLVTAAADAVDATISTVLNGTIDPLARQVAGRWKRLFADRGPLHVTGRGALSREIQGEILPFASFSTGERMAAQLLLRLMILNAATNATYCWIDEPLEHLDPDARRQVATMLALTPATTSLKQLLVTTYEEPLARRLSERMVGDVNLVYVRAGDSKTT